MAVKLLELLPRPRVSQALASAQESYYLRLIIQWNDSPGDTLERRRSGYAQSFEWLPWLGGSGSSTRAARVAHSTQTTTYRAAFKSKSCVSEWFRRHPTQPVDTPFQSPWRASKLIAANDSVDRLSTIPTIVNEQDRDARIPAGNT
ncbi:hypothetical protein FRB93_000259 [Tulasnella sp. JGI-2019a]|nr:hypothetical protein FRB93_000259 [Tulasnella sp. JGI-2019a]